ncbi:choline-glycine betaine transporter [Sphingomonas zeicaulis]
MYYVPETRSWTLKYWRWPADYAIIWGWMALRISGDEL